MENAIKELEIQNFKSIKNIKFNPKRVNVIIGKPNVGKSNILEGMTLMTSKFLQYNNGFFKDNSLIRFEELYNLFYDDDTSSIVSVKSDKAGIFLRKHRDNFFFYSLNFDEYYEQLNALTASSTGYNFQRDYNDFYSKTESLNLKDKKQHKFYLSPFFGSYFNDGNSQSAGIAYNHYINPIKRFSFKEFQNYSDSFRDYLQPPFGENLLSVLEAHKELLNEIAGFIEEQGLEFVVDKKESKFLIQKKIERIVYLVPYLNIADTLKHIIFYLAAIETNKDSVLLLEEPEVHSYPPYVKMLADRIVLNDENQYFITTHSPYMLNTLIDNLKDEELNVILTYYEDYQTKIKILSSEEISEIQEWQMDVFFNIDRFTDLLQNH